MSDVSKARIGRLFRYLIFMPKDFDDNPDDLEKPPSFFPYDEEEEQTPVGPGEPVEVGIEGIYAAESNGSVHRFVLLSDGHRKLSILIGPYEAQAITMPIEGIQADRPMTHDLIKAVIDKLGGRLEKVVIDDMWSTTYYAKLSIFKGKEEVVIDCRPSDAIALAIRFNTPIYVAEGLLEVVGD